MVTSPLIVDTAGRARARRATSAVSFAAVATLALLAGCGGVGDSSPSERRSFDSARAEQPSSSPDPSTTALLATSAATASRGVRLTTTSTKSGTFEARSYAAGECIRWTAFSSAATTGPDRDVRTVPCDEPHYAEMVGRMDVPAGGPFSPMPDESAWDEVITSSCVPAIEAHTHRPLDPYGRFQAWALRPTPDGWAHGDRTAWCGIRLAWPPQQQAPNSWTGHVADLDQSVVYDDGTCLQDASPVDCGAAHNSEVTGRVDLTGRASDLPSDYQALVGQDCVRKADSYLGSPLRPDARVGWLKIPPESWAAGRRILNCVVFVVDGAGQHVTLTGPLR